MTATGPVAEPSDNMQRGTKRKNAYDIETREEDPGATTPASRTRSRRSSATPSTVSRASASKAKRFTAKRSSAIGGVAPESLLNPAASANTDIEEPAPAPRAPMADMGGAELFAKQPSPQPENHESEPAPENTVSDEETIKEETEKRPSPGMSARKKTASQQAEKEQPVEQRAEVLLGKKIEEEDIHEVEALLAHKVSEDNPGHVLLQIKWVDDTETTWEPEEEIQDGASELLFNYWKKQGGRDAALFEGSNPLMAQQYYIYKILEHERVRSTFRFRVQWVGYPADASVTSIESEVKLKKCAQELLDEYWAMKGGRDKFIAKRGRTKKTRTAY